MHQNAPIAVLLNANARQVNARMRAALSGVVPAEDLYLSRDSQDARDIADEVVERGYKTVLTGGGDGTFVSWVNHILDESEKQSSPAPRFGVLALGTGNAVAEVVGAAKSDVLNDVRNVRDGRVRAYRKLELLTCEGRRTPFAGLGYDAAILNDYVWLKNRLAKGPLKKLAAGGAGYAVAVSTRSVPRAVMERRPSYCEIVNLGRAAYRLDALGKPVGPPIGHGEVIYAGPAKMAAAGTVPFYGLGFKMFPFAGQREGFMQLRVVGNMPVPSILLNLKSIWKGHVDHPAVLDFFVERAALKFERPMPLQIGGDAEGWRDQVTFAMADRSVELVDYNGELN
jgi:diacylglycerol kinase family enzyme